jgi:hypothetical protein
MKSLFFTLLIIAAAFVAYDYFGAPPGQKMIFKSMNAGVPAASAAPSAQIPAAAKDEPIELPKGKPVADAPPGAATTAPAPSATPPAPAPAAPPVPDADGFTPPRFEPLEVLTKGWTFIPPSAFDPPRGLKLTKDVEFKLSAGSSKLAAGSTAYALGMANGVLTVAPAPTSPARAQVPLDDTDLKTILHEGYERWKPLRTAALKKIWERKRAMAAGGEPAGTTLAGSTDESGRPRQNADGSYDLLIASMKSGQVTEPKPENVKNWGQPTEQLIEGKNGWAVRVRYEAATIFGPMEVEAQALIVSGKVKGWYYTGSGEEVP